MEDLQIVEHVVRTDPAVIEQCVISGIKREDMDKVYCDRELFQVELSTFAHHWQRGPLATMRDLARRSDYNKRSCTTVRTWMITSTHFHSTFAPSSMQTSKKSSTSTFQKSAGPSTKRHQTTITQLPSRRTVVIVRISSRSI